MCVEAYTSMPMCSMKCTFAMFIQFSRNIIETSFKLADAFVITYWLYKAIIIPS